MEQLVRDLQELGYVVEWNVRFSTWEVRDFCGDVCDYISYGFLAVVLRHGFTFSITIQWDICKLFVKFVKL